MLLFPKRIQSHALTVTGKASTFINVSWLETVDHGPVRVLTLNRPDRKNAIPLEGWDQLRTAFEDFGSAPSRVLVVTGAGGDFCSGADLDPSRIATVSSVVDSAARMKMVGAAANALHRIAKPTIAAVDGVAVGAGMNLALGCDLVVASDRARFAEIFVRRGLTVDFGGTWILPRLVGMQRAKELVLSGRTVLAEEALDIGLVLEVVPAEALLDRALELAHSLLAGAPFVQTLAKRGLNTAFQSSFTETLGWEGQSQAIAWSSPDAIEGVTAFLERRDPIWSGSDSDDKA